MVNTGKNWMDRATFCVVVACAFTCGLMTGTGHPVLAAFNAFAVLYNVTVLRTRGIV